jgi:hypothetical protein
LKKLLTSTIELSTDTMADEFPAKKMCLEKGKQGKKIPELAEAFEPYGVALRVRCKLCYQEWFQKGVQRLIDEGICLSAFVRNENPCCIRRP